MTFTSPSPSISQATDFTQCLLCANILLGAWDIMETKQSLQTGRGHTEWLKNTNMNVYVQTELRAVGKGIWFHKSIDWWPGCLRRLH